MIFQLVWEGRFLRISSKGVCVSEFYKSKFIIRIYIAPLEIPIICLIQSTENNTTEMLASEGSRRQGIKIKNVPEIV